MSKVSKIGVLEVRKTPNFKIFRGCAPNPPGGAYSALQTPQLLPSAAGAASLFASLTLSLLAYNLKYAILYSAHTKHGFHTGVGVGVGVGFRNMFSIWLGLGDDVINVNPLTNQIHGFRVTL